MIRSRPRDGQTMLELVAATVIISIALVPAMRVTRTCIFNTSELEKAESRLNLCTSKMEESLALTAATWDLSSSTGTMPGPGGSEFAYQVTKSDAIPDGGIPDTLVAIQVIVWDDKDADQTVDFDERRVKLATKMARLLSYEDAFNED